MSALSAVLVLAFVNPTNVSDVDVMPYKTNMEAVECMTEARVLRKKYPNIIADCVLVWPPIKAEEAK